MAKIDAKTQRLIESVAHELGSSARAEVVFGEPLERDGVTVIPVATASIGLGSGGAPGRKSGEQGVVGAGLRVSPVGYIEVTDGSVRFRRILPTWAFVSIAVGACAIAALLLYRRTTPSAAQRTSTGAGQGVSA